AGAPPEVSRQTIAAREVWRTEFRLQKTGGYGWTFTFEEPTTRASIFATRRQRIGCIECIASKSTEPPHRSRLNQEASSSGATCFESRLDFSSVRRGMEIR